VAACGVLKFGSHTTKRWLVLESEIKTLFRSYKPDLVILETNFQYKNVKTTAGLNQLRGAVCLLAALDGIEVRFLDNNQAKKHMLGGTKWWNGEKYAGVTKEMMEAAVCAALCEHSMQPQENNAADAVAIAFTYFDVKLEPTPLARKPQAPKPARRKASKKCPSST
jgi:Holliday junction resolvasome RuvABC endonuclease subunit